MVYPIALVFVVDLSARVIVIDFTGGILKSVSNVRTAILLLLQNFRTPS